MTRRLARGLMRLYYPVIEVSHRERIPPSGPVLFAANHPNSLLDPPVIGWVTQRPVRFYAKAPLFELPVLGGLLHAGGMVPAYRGVQAPVGAGGARLPPSLPAPRLPAVNRARTRSSVGARYFCGTNCALCGR